MHRRFLCVLLAMAAPASRAPAAGSGERAEYVGGTVGDLPKASGVIDLTGQHFFSFRTRDRALEIGYDRINLIEYGQKVDRRYAMAIVVSPLLLLSKSRKHFLTVGYTDEAGRQQALVFRVDKDHIRSVLAGLEAKTGRKIQYQDPEARKAGKG